MPSLGANELTLTIRAVDDASPALRNVRNSIDGVSSSGDQNRSVAQKLRDNWAPIAAVTAAAGGGFYIAKDAISQTFDAANKLNGAMTGLTSVATYFEIDAGKARDAARSLASDGLMTVSEAATGLKNLLSSGFSLEEAITIMERFKDTAAFGRQASLQFGQAVVGATEGIKNGNSILSDNAGMTKNLSQILVEAGYSQQDLNKATTDSNIRQALFKGILKETNPMVGDAAKLSGQFAGEQAKASAATTTLKENIGLALQTALRPLLQAAVPVIQAVAQWVKEHEKLAAAIAIGMTVFLGLATVIGGIAGVIMLVGSTAALAFGGIILVVAAAVAAIIVYWEPIKNFFSGIWKGIQNIVGGVVNWIGDKVNWFKDHWLEALGFIVGFFATLPIKLPIFVFRAIGAIIDWVKNIDWGKVFSAIASAFGKVWDLVKKGAKAVWEWLKNIDWGAVAKGFANGIISILEGAINGALAGLPGDLKVHLPRFATGTNYAPGGLALVGEYGPELVNLPRGSQVKTASETRQIIKNSGSAGVTINGGVHVHNEMDEMRLLRNIGWRLSLAS